MTALGDALAQIRSFIALGGPIVAILAVVSVIAFAVILMKVLQFSRMRVGARGRAREAVALWLDGRPREALALAGAGRSVSATSVATAMTLVLERRLAKPAIEERVARHAAEKLHDLQSGFRLLDAVAQLSPLMGLFGTVIGMIEAFQKLQSAGNAVDPSILAGGIWVALLTTAAGLAVAMPVSLVLTWLEGRLDSERVAIETLTTDVLNGGARDHSEAAEAPGMEAVLAH